MAEEIAAPAAPEKAPPIPDTKTKRPGTSGTELDLRASRVAASTAFQRAARAEQTYRSRRQASNARRDMKAAKEFYVESINQLKLGVSCSVRAVKAVPAVMREKKEERREKREEAKRVKAEMKRKVWEEKARGKEGKDEAPLVAGGLAEGEGEGEGGAAATATATTAAA